MPEIEITIGGRSFGVACQGGEEHFLETAAKMLDQEASALGKTIGRLPEARMLLMAGLMLADKTAGLDEQLRVALSELDVLRQDLKALQEQPAPPPERVEVAVVPPAVPEMLAELAARAEAVADQLETQNSGDAEVGEKRF